MDRRAALMAMSASTLSACGFELRRAPKLPFRSIALVGFEPQSPVGQSLRQQLTAGSVQVMEAPANAEAVFEALIDKREKSVVASTAAGQVREVQLRAKLRFRVATPAGKLLLAVDELLLTRDMSYSETAALAKAQEEALLYRAMEDDIVAQVLRRLAAIKLVS
ncbi:MAG: LPS assembly lipoprotein LptE [Burkholderiaceae bacterium]|nr:LPS assembly lipoprotein LptE [Burkholderiaceae bacterium]